VGVYRRNVTPTSIQRFAGDRRALLPLFRRADDSDAAIERYLDDGDLLVVLDGDLVAGHVQLVTDERWQINSLAVLPSHAGQGLGRALVEAAVAHARRLGARTIEVATATADVGVLRFYQRLGFRMARIERDAFTPAAGYPADLTVDGVSVLDRVWLDRSIA
jgi:ribosomal protein S18 acetylase RimI-like enzyme